MSRRKQRLWWVLSPVMALFEKKRNRHTMGLGKDPSCRFCGKEDETSLHVILECPTLVERRGLYLGDPFLLANNIEVRDVRKILQFYEKTMG